MFCIQLIKVLLIITHLDTNGVERGTRREIQTHSEPYSSQKIKPISTLQLNKPLQCRSQKAMTALKPWQIDISKGNPRSYGIPKKTFWPQLIGMSPCCSRSANSINLVLSIFRQNKNQAAKKHNWHSNFWLVTNIFENLPSRQTKLINPQYPQVQLLYHQSSNHMNRI